MQTTKHTPTPWEIKHFPKQFDEEIPMFFIRSTDTHLPSGHPRPEIMADDAHEGNGYPIEQKLADAELIVTAVNNFKEMKKFITLVSNFNPDGNPERIVNEANNILRALQKIQK
jgi:hypothetical protein